MREVHPHPKGRKFEILYKVPGYSKNYSERFNSMEEAELRAAEINLQKRNGTLKPPEIKKKNTGITVESFLAEYVSKYGLNHWGDSYLSMCRSRIENYIVPYIGHYLLQDVTAGLLTEYYAQLVNCNAKVRKGYKTAKKITPSVIERLHSLLRAAFSYAIVCGYISTNPATNAVTPKYTKEERAVWSPATAKSALQLCDDPVLKLSLTLAIAGSLRIGELLGLKWCDFELDTDSPCMHIRRELKRCQNEDLSLLKVKPQNVIYETFPSQKKTAKSVLVLKQLKTTSSRRTVYISDYITNELIAYRNVQAARDSRCFKDHDLVFSQENGSPIEPRFLEKKFKSFCMTNNLPVVVFHSLRHLSTSLKLQATNGAVKAVQGDTGHSVAAMVVDIYAHTFDEDRKAIPERMDQLFFKPETPIKSEDELIVGFLHNNLKIREKILEMLKEEVSSEEIRKKSAN